MRVQGTAQFPSPLYYASLLGFQASVEKMLKRGVRVTEEGRFGNAPVASAVCRHWNITKTLLDKHQDIELGDLLLIVRRIKGDVDATLKVFLESGNLFGPERRRKENGVLIMQYAASNTSCGDTVSAFILKNGGEDILVTASVVEAAATNEKIAHKIIGILLEIRGSKLPISPQASKAAAGNWYRGEKIFSQLLGHGVDFPLTEDILEETTSNEQCADKALALLFTSWDSNIPIDEGVVSNGAKNQVKGDRAMVLILSKWGMQTPITESAHICCWKLWGW